MYYNHSSMVEIGKFDNCIVYIDTTKTSFFVTCNKDKVEIDLLSSSYMNKEQLDNTTIDSLVRFLQLPHKSFYKMGLDNYTTMLLYSNQDIHLPMPDYSKLKEE